MPFSHDSLLFDCKDQKLTNQEKMLAEQNFEMNRKNGGKLTSRFSFASDFSTINEPPAAESMPKTADFSSRLENEASLFKDYFPNASDYMGLPFSSGNRLLPPPYEPSSDSNDVICTGTSFSRSPFNGGYGTSYGADRLADQFNSTLHRFGAYGEATNLYGEPLDLSVMKSRNMTVDSGLSQPPFTPVWDMNQARYLGVAGYSQQDSSMKILESAFNSR